MTLGKVLVQAKNCDCEFEIAMELYENANSMQLNKSLRKKVSILKSCTMHELAIRNNLLKAVRNDTGANDEFEMLRSYLSDLSNQIT